MRSQRNLYESIAQNRILVRAHSITNRIREALKEVNHGCRCLDIGCGDGIFSSLIKANYQYIYGIDCSNTSAIQAKSNGISVILADIDEGFMPFTEDTFDLISCLDVIEHVFDPVKLLNEIHRVLLTHGTLIITTPNIRFIDFIKDLILNGQFPRTSHDKEGFDGGHIRYFTFKDLRDLLIKTGFYIEIERGYDNKNYRSLKIFLFKLIMRCYEKDMEKEFFCPGILIKAKKI